MTPVLISVRQLCESQSKNIIEKKYLLAVGGISRAEFLKTGGIGKDLEIKLGSE